MDDFDPDGIGNAPREFAFLYRGVGWASIPSQIDNCADSAYCRGEPIEDQESVERSFFILPEGSE